MVDFAFEKKEKQQYATMAQLLSISNVAYKAI
jgi:hypothetical protein